MPCMWRRKTIIAYIPRLLKFVVGALMGTSD